MQLGWEVISFSWYLILSETNETTSPGILFVCKAYYMLLE